MVVANLLLQLAQWSRKSIKKQFALNKKALDTKCHGPEWSGARISGSKVQNGEQEEWTERNSDKNIGKFFLIGEQRQVYRYNKFKSSLINY